MAVKKRCPYCLKKLRPNGTCGYEKCPRYVPDPEPEPTPEPPSEGTTTPSEGNTTTTTETPSTGESATNTSDGGNMETEPTP